MEVIMKIKQIAERLNSVPVRKKVKRILALTLAVLMMNPVTGYGIAAHAQEVETITAFAKLSNQITIQQLAVGAEESDINLPETLSVTLSVYGAETTENVVEDSQPEEIPSEEAKPDESTPEEPAVDETPADDSTVLDNDAEEPEEPQEDANAAENNTATDSQATVVDIGEVPLAASTTGSAINADLDDVDTEQTETETITTEERTLTGITWEINAERSGSDTFDSANAGAVFFYEPVLPESYTLADGLSMPQIQVKIEENVQWAFSRSQTIDGIEITVKAEKDVFPEGAVLHAKKVTSAEDKEKIQSAVSEEVQAEDAAKTVAELVSFDITITDADGNELQPDTSKGEVKVSFAQLPMVTEDTAPTQELKVFHMDDSLSEVTGLDTTVNQEAESVEATAEHFSVYIVAQLTDEIRANVEAEIKDSDGTLTYYDTIEEAITAAIAMNGSTVTLQKDAETTDNVIINSGNFTIDLNGKTLTCNQLNVATGAVLSMQDSSGNNRGSYIGAIFTEGELNISGGTYKYTGNINFNYTEGSITIQKYITIFAKNGSSGEISGGIFQRNIYNASYYALSYESDSNLKIIGGFFDSINGLGNNTDNKLPVGYCLMKSNNEHIDRPGKYLFIEVTVEECTDHNYGTQRYCQYCHAENPDYGGPVWVTIDGTTTKYEMIEIANAFATANGNTATITLNTDVNATNLSLTSGTIIIDLNGHKLRSGIQYSHILDLNGAEVILRNGTAEIAESNNGIKLSSGSLTIENVTFSSVSSSASLNIQGGTVEINGANFQDSMSIQQTGGHLTVSEGNFEGMVELDGGETLLEGGHYSSLIIDDYDDVRTIADLLPMGGMMKLDTGSVYSKDQLNIKEISQVAVLEAPIKITAQPQNAESVTYGYSIQTSITMSVTAEKTSTASEGSSITYQWYRVQSGSETSDTALGTTDTQTMPNDLDAGTHSFYCVITCGDYIVNSQSADFIVEKAAPSIGLAVRILGDNPFIYGEGVYLQANINGENGENPDGRVTFMIDGVTGTTVDYDGYEYYCQTGIEQVLDAGNHSFTAVYTPSTDGTGKNYESATSATLERTIAKADQATLSITGVTGKKYGDADFTLETTGGSGEGAVTYSVPDNNGVLSINGNTATIIGAGAVSVTAIKAADTNYNEATATQLITITKAAAPSITWPNASGITYGQKLSASALSVSSTEYGTFAWTDGSTVPTVTNGGYEVTFTPNAGTVANYEAITNTTKMVAITVSKATPAVTVNAVVSDDAGSRKATLTATVTGAGDGETPTGTVKFVNSTSGSDVDIAGATIVTITGGKATYIWTGLASQIYKVKAVYSGSANYNNATSTELSFDTNKQNQAALNIGSIGTKTYGDGTFTLSVTGGSGGGAVTFESSDPTIVSISGTTATIHKAGIVTITATKAANNTYNEVTASVSLTVGKKTLSVKTDDKLNVVKGAAMPELTYTATGLVDSDTFTSPSISTTATDTNTVGEYDILISGGTLANADSYAVTYTNGKLTVVNAVYTVTVTNGTGDGSYSEGQAVTITADSRGGYTFTGWSSSDGVTFASNTASTTTFTMPGKAVTVTANYSKNSSGDSGDSNGDSTTNNTNSNNDNANSNQTNAGESAATDTGANQNTTGTSQGVTSLQDENNAQSEEAKPYLAGEEGKSGWEVIMTEIEETSNEVNQEPVTMTVEMNGATTIPANVIATLRGKNINLVLDMGDGITWTINGMDVSDAQLFDIDLGVTRNTDVIPEDVVDGIRGDNNSIQIELAHNGAFGFGATLTIAFDEGDAGKFANLFYYNEETGKLEYMESAQVEEDGKATLTFVHASAYTIVLSNEAMDEGTVASVTDTANQTQDSTQAVSNEVQATDETSGSMMAIWILLGIIVVVASGGTTIYMRRKAGKEEDEN